MPLLHSKGRPLGSEPTSQSSFRDEALPAAGFAMAILWVFGSAALAQFNTRATLARPYAIAGASVLVASALVFGYLRVLRHRRRIVASRIYELEVFAARVAHDVRSPLTSAILALRYATAGLAPDDHLRAIIGRADRSLHNLEQLVQDLLAFALSGVEPERGASASVADTLEEMLAEHLGLAEANGVDLSLRLDVSNDRTHAACAPGVLASIVGNLLGNAIKFMGDSPQRRVEVRAGRNGRCIRIEIADTGPGLPVGVEPEMFEPFVRGDLKAPGTGLGLATVKRLVTAHGGSIAYRRRDPHGSTFSVDLPAADGDEAA
jgi:signal transduction histidine kinase